MKTPFPRLSVLPAIAGLMLCWLASASAIPVARGFVSETPRAFEYNSGFLAAGDSLTAAFSVFGGYPGMFDSLNADYYPLGYPDTDSVIVVGTSYLNSYYWSGDEISGDGTFFEFGSHPLLIVTATFQDATLNTSVGNVNIRGFYSGHVDGEGFGVPNVPDSGSTLGLLGGCLLTGWIAMRLNRLAKT